MHCTYDITITSYCQAYCAGCARNTMDGNKLDTLVESHIQLPAFETIIKNLTSSKKYPVNQIQLCGEYGDPMMHPDIEKIIDITLAHAPSIKINTNGGLRNSQWYKHIVLKYGDRLYINWGIDGIDHDTNWKYRKGVVFDRAWKNMQEYFLAGGKGCWDFIVFEWNYHQIADVIRLAKSMNADYDIKISLSDDVRSGLIENSKTYNAALSYLEEIKK